MKLTKLEREVLDWFADHAGSDELRQQCQVASIVSREHTGPGQFIKFQCPEEAPNASFPTSCVPNAPLISSVALPHGAAVDLWLKEGKIEEMEIVALGGAELPKDEFPFKLVDEL
jgi:hypothetical protein